MKTVLITGATGDVGTHLSRELAGKYKLRLSDKRPMKAPKGQTFVKADISKMADALRITKGVDAIVHLGGYSVEGPWEGILSANLIGCYNVFEAARRAGVKRVVFASSNHAVGFHRRDRMIDDAVAPRPDSRYGVSKVFGEALGRMYADKHGMSVACMRIGSFRPDDAPTAPRHLFTWISHRDMVQLAKRCIDTPDYHFVIVYGVSGNARNRWDNANVRRLGYAPQDDAELHAAQIAATGQTEDAREALFHGGFGCLVEFDGDPQRID
jgi:uronate dehydrogenase